MPHTVWMKGHPVGDYGIVPSIALYSVALKLLRLYKLVELDGAVSDLYDQHFNLLWEITKSET